MICKEDSVLEGNGSEGTGVFVDDLAGLPRFDTKDSVLKCAVKGTV